MRKREITHFKVLTWSRRHDEEVMKALVKVLGPSVAQKQPRERVVTKRRMIGTGQMTDAREADLRARLGKKISILDKEPFGWIDSF